ncbi:MAG: hypothetical protein Fur0037_21570 [Planctomycetota bacterium]
MKILRLALAVLLASLASLATAQRPLTHDDCDSWKSLRGVAVSRDRRWVAYALEPQVGDPLLEVRSTDGSRTHRHPLGTGPRFTSDGRFVVFRIVKSKVEEHRKKIEELRKKAAKGKAERSEQQGQEPENEPVPQRSAGVSRRGRRGPGMPGAGGSDSEPGDMGILELATGKVEVVKRVKSFSVPPEAPWFAYHLERPEPEKSGETKPGKTKPEQKAQEPARQQREEAGPPSRGAEEAPRGQRRQRAGMPPPSRGSGAGQREPAEDPLQKKRKDGSDLVVRDLATGSERRFADVVGCGTSRKARWLYFHTSAKKPREGEHYGVYVLDSRSGPDAPPTRMAEGIADWTGFASDREETVLAFASNLEDFAAEKPVYDLWIWEGGRSARRIVRSRDSWIPEGKTISPSGLSFSRDGGVLAFGLRDLPDDDLPPILPEDKVALDLWNWHDGVLQTAQARRGSRKTPWSAVYHRDQGRVVVLGDDEVEQVRLLTPDGSLAMATDGKPYEKLSTWDGRYIDVYLVNTVIGSRTRVLERLRGNVRSSPEGRYLVWFGTDYRWWSLDVVTLRKTDLTGALPVPFHDVDDDHPEPAPP